MTPPRLNELECPRCGRASWIFDSDFRGMDGGWIPYDRRFYKCGACGLVGSGWKLLQQSPPAFLLQPHQLYPMTQAEFDHWVGILRANFPGSPRLRDPSFAPCTPEEAKAHQQEFERLHPVFEMRDHDGTRCATPSLNTVLDWVDVMKPGEFLLLRRRDSASLRLTSTPGKWCSATCLGPDGGVIAEAPALDGSRVRAAVERYLDGDVQPLDV
jgi:hypothetical protein